MFFITLLSVVVVAGGFVVLHFARTHRTTELKVAGWVLVIGGLTNVFALYYMTPRFMMAMPPVGNGFSVGGQMRMGGEMPDMMGHQCQRKAMMHDMMGDKMPGDKMVLEAPPPPPPVAPVEEEKAPAAKHSMSKAKP